MASVNEAAAAFGLAIGPDDALQDEDLELWPENETAVRLFTALLSQWRMGMSGPTGLDYAAIPAVAPLLKLRGRRLREAFSGLQVMEAEALRYWRER